MFRQLALSSLVAVAALSGAALAQYPNRPVTMVVPYAAGGPTDTVARVMGVAMSKPLGQTLIVENKPSAGGILGPEQVKNAKPDGYTILIHHIGMATTPALYRQLRYKPMEDFEPIGLINDVPMTIIARQNFPAKDFKEFLAYIKANKDKVTYANAGIGAASHLCGMLFMSAIQTDVLTVPYKGTAPALKDVVGGHIDLLCDQTTVTTPQVKAGMVKVYGVTSKERVSLLPEVPTFDEQGLANFEILVWFALWAPKGLPKPVFDKLVTGLQSAVVDPAFKAKVNDFGGEPVPVAKANPEALRSFFQAEIDKWRPIIQKAGVYAD